jgi:hypothetical protein
MQGTEAEAGARCSLLRVRRKQGPAGEGFHRTEKRLMLHLNKRQSAALAKRCA